MWKDIANYEGLYKVNNIGEVYSIRTNKFIKPTIRNNYLAVGLWKNGKVKMKSIHRLVAETFIPNIYNLPEVNHINEDKTDNRVENLEWCTRKYNTNYGTRNKKISSYLSKPVAQYDLNGTLVKKYNSIKEAAKALGKCDYSIRACLYGKYKTGYNYVWRLC
jgi:hypothetical protein